MTNNANIVVLMPILSAIFGALITWILSRTKSQAEVAKVKEETAHMYLRNVEDAVGLWKSIAKDLETQVHALTTEVKMLRAENSELKKELERLEKTINNKL